MGRTGILGPWRQVKMAQLVVQLTADGAAALVEGGGGAAPIRQVLNELGVTLQPLSPGIDDPVLSTYFHATLPSAKVGAEAVARLRDVPGVTAAYLKPAIALP
jgi:hypothetical protein